MTNHSHLTVALPYAYLTDPHLWVDARATLSIRFALYESLVRYDRQGGIVAGLASSWDVSPDARTWTFTLRRGVRFHNGALLTARDVVASVWRATRPEMPGEYGTAALLSMYLENMQIDALDDLHVRIVLPEPMADLLDLLIYAVILPANALEGDLCKAPGTGAYRLASAQSAQGERICLERFAEYWGNPAGVELLELRGVADRDERVRLFQQGAVDLAPYLPVAARPAFNEDPTARLFERAGSLCVILMFNAFQGPCADPRVRQALNYATNVDALIDALYDGHADRLNGPLSPRHSGADPQLAPYAYDPEKARELLRDAGYAQGLTLTLDRPEVSPDESAQLAALLKAQWQQVGVTLEERIHTDRENYALQVREKHIGDLCVFDSSPMSTFRVLREKLHSRFAGPWWEGYHNPSVNAVMEQAWSIVDDQARTQCYRQAFRLIQQDAPWLFLYSPHDLWAARGTPAGWQPGLDGLVIF